MASPETLTLLERPLRDRREGAPEKPEPLDWLSLKYPRYAQQATQALAEGWTAEEADSFLSQREQEMLFYRKQEDVDAFFGRNQETRDKLSDYQRRVKVYGYWEARDGLLTRDEIAERMALAHAVKVQESALINDDDLYKKFKNSTTLRKLYENDPWTSQWFTQLDEPLVDKNVGESLTQAKNLFADPVWAGVVGALGGTFKGVGYAVSLPEYLERKYATSEISPEAYIPPGAWSSELGGAPLDIPVVKKKRDKIVTEQGLLTDIGDWLITKGVGMSEYAGETMRDAAEGGASNIIQEIMQGVGSSAGFMLAGMGAGAAASGLGKSAQLFIGALTEGGLEAFSEAGDTLGNAVGLGLKDEGMEQASNVFLSNLALNTALNFLGGRYNPMIDKIGNQDMRRMMQMAANVVEEAAAQEPLQGVISESAEQAVENGGGFLKFLWENLKKYPEFFAEVGASTAGSTLLMNLILPGGSEGMSRLTPKETPTPTEAAATETNQETSQESAPRESRGDANANVNETVYLPRKALEAYNQERPGRLGELNIDVEQGTEEETALSPEQYEALAKSDPEFVKSIENDVRRGAKSLTDNEAVEKIQKMTTRGLYGKTPEAQAARDAMADIEKRAVKGGGFSQPVAKAFSRVAASAALQLSRATGRPVSDFTDFRMVREAYERWRASRDPNAPKITRHLDPATGKYVVERTGGADIFDQLGGENLGTVSIGDRLLPIRGVDAKELEKFLDSGKLPAPSIGIVKDAYPTTGYGQITVIFGRDTIDPANDPNNRLYQGDGMTPRYPRIEEDGTFDDHTYMGVPGFNFDAGPQMRPATPENILEHFRRNEPSSSKLTLGSIEDVQAQRDDIKTEGMRPYYEAKPYRIVNADEIKGVVLPANLPVGYSERLREKLKAKGIPFEEFKDKHGSWDPPERTKAVRKLARKLGKSGDIFFQSAEFWDAEETDRLTRRQAQASEAIYGFLDNMQFKKPEYWTGKEIWRLGRLHGNFTLENPATWGLDSRGLDRMLGIQEVLEDEDLQEEYSPEAIEAFQEEWETQQAESEEQLANMAEKAREELERRQPYDVRRLDDPDERTWIISNKEDPDTKLYITEDEDEWFDVYEVDERGEEASYGIKADYEGAERLAQDSLNEILFGGDDVARAIEETKTFYQTASKNAKDGGSLSHDELRTKFRAGEVTAEEFIAARDKSSKMQFMTVYSTEEMAGPNFKLFLTEDGVGFALKTRDDGKIDMVNVFNNSSRKGAGQEIVTLAISEGAQTTDCYGGFLDKYYNKFGFNEVGRYSWDESQRPEGWDYEKFGTPDYVELEYHEGLSRNVDDIGARFEFAGTEQASRGGILLDWRDSGVNAGLRESARGRVGQGEQKYAGKPAGVRSEPLNKQTANNPQGRPKQGDPESLSTKSMRDPPPNATTELLGEFASLMTFFETANPSSPFHEFMHHVLNIYDKLSDMDGVDDQLKRDFESVLKEFGVTKEQFRTDEDTRRDVHERFAKGFEAYLATGEAPSKTLKNVFARVKQWLIEVYGDVQAALGIEVSETMKGIYDRLLASPDEITAEYESRTKIGDLAAEYEALKNRIEDFNRRAREAVAAGLKFEEWEVLQRMKTKRDEKAELKAEINKLVKGIENMADSKNINYYKQLAIKEKLSGYDLKRRRKDTLEHRAETEAYLSGNPEAGEAMNPADLKYLGTTTLNGMTIEDLRKLDAEIRELYEQGQKEYKDWEAQGQERVDKMNAEMKKPLEKIKPNLPLIKTKPEDLKKQYKGIRGKLEKVKDWGYAATLGSHRFFDWLDGGATKYDGPFVRYFVDAVNKARDGELRHTFERRNWIQTKLRELGLDMKEFSLIRAKDVYGKDFTVDEIMEIYIGMRNEKKRKAILYGVFENQGVTDPQGTINDLISRLSEAEKQAAELVVQDHDRNVDRIEKSLVEAFNKGFDREENYSSIHRIEFGSPQGMIDAESAEALAEGVADAGFLQRVEDGFTKTRVVMKDENQMSIKLGLFSNWHDDVSSHEHSAAFARLAKDTVRALMAGDPVAKAHGVQTTIGKMIKERFGDETWRTLVDFFNIAVTDDSRMAHNMLDGIASTMAKNMSITYLAGNAATVLKQFTSIPRFLVTAGPHRILAALGKFMYYQDDFLEEIYEMDPQMRDRMGSDLLRALRQDPNWAKSKYQKFLQVALAPISMMDRWVAAIGWRATYDANLKNLGKEGAIREAQRAVALTQQTAHAKDAPRIWRQSGYARLIMTFTSDGAQTFGMTAYDFAQQVRTKQGRKALMTLTALAVTAILMKAATDGFPGAGDEDEEEEGTGWGRWTAEAFSEQAIASIPLVGKELMALYDGVRRNYSGTHYSAIVTPFERLIRARKIMKKEEPEEDDGWKATWNVVEAMSLTGLAPVPVTSAKRLWNALGYINDYDPVGAAMIMVGKKAPKRE